MKATLRFINKYAAVLLVAVLFLCMVSFVYTGWNIFRSAAIGFTYTLLIIILTEPCYA